MPGGGAARRIWEEARTFALTLPAAEEDRPWGEVAVKVRKKPGVPPWRKDGEGVYGPMFLWLGRPEADELCVAVKLNASYEAAVAIAGARPTTMSGLGKWGWLTVPLESLDAGLLCDWIEESYRAVAPRSRIAELEASRS